MLSFKNSTFLLKISEMVLGMMDDSESTAACVKRQKTEKCLLPALRKKLLFPGCKCVWSDRSSLIPEEDSL